LVALAMEKVQWHAGGALAVLKGERRRSLLPSSSSRSKAEQDGLVLGLAAIAQPVETST
jgi:cation transport regulator ChaC